jgi:hypothetical protein
MGVESYSKIMETIEKESSVLGQLVYRNRNQHRSTKLFELVNQVLDRLILRDASLD